MFIISLQTTDVLMLLFAIHIYFNFIVIIIIIITIITCIKFAKYFVMCFNAADKAEHKTMLICVKQTLN